MDEDSVRNYAGTVVVIMLVMAVAPLAMLLNLRNHVDDLEVSTYKDHIALMEVRSELCELQHELVKLGLPKSIMKTSWYGAEWQGRTMANGGKFNSSALTAAHRTLPMGTRLMLQHKDRSVLVTITDRGPALRTGNELDISEQAAKTLNMIGTGTAHLAVTRLK